MINKQRTDVMELDKQGNVHRNYDAHIWLKKPL